MWTVEDGNQDGHAQIGIDEGACRLVTPVEVAGLAETKIDRDEHQTRAMSHRYCKGPEPQLRRSYPRHYPRMVPADELEDAEPDDKEAGADLNLLLPLDEGEQERERKYRHEHRQQMADRQRPKCCHQGARTPFHQPG